MMGIFKTLFGGNKEIPESTMSLDSATKIASAYGDILENNAPVPGTIADDSKLPYPKSVIKQALTILLHTNTDPQMKEHIKTAYLLLADWQVGVGQTNVGLDFTNMDPTDDPKKFAEQVLSQSGSAEKWDAMAQKERLQLKSELQGLGLS